MKKRFYFFLLLNAALVLTWIVYLFIVQLLDPFDFENVVKLRTNPSKEIIIPKRGKIFDANMNLLVNSNKYYQLDLDRKIIIKECKKNKTDVETILAKIVRIMHSNSDLSENYLTKVIYKKPLSTSIYISENFNESQMLSIKKAFKTEKIAGLISTFSKTKRNYPLGKLGSTFLGLVKESSTNDERGIEESIYKVHGVCGLEKSFEEELSGEIGWKETIEDANNRRIPFLSLRSKKEKPGNSLVLTIDNNFQEILEERLARGLEKYKAKNAIGIIMDPQTAKIKAMAGLTKGHQNSSAKVLRSSPNLPVSFMFEPGSTLKPITALLALENDIYRPKDEIDCTAYHLLYNEEERTIKDDHKYNMLNFHDIIAYSSNVGISKIVEKIGRKKLYERLIALGFRHKIGYKIANEASGIFRKLSDWQGFSLHSISFGQEISVTALQLANAYCALANGGNVMQPYFVDRIVSENDEIIEQFKPKVLRHISDEKSLNTLKDFLKSVVDYGTATATKIDFLDVAGKTGTAEKVLSGNYGYAKEKYTSVFAGFFPVKHPRYVIVIAYDEADFESYSYYASLSAVPTFKNIVLDINNLPQSTIVSDLKQSSTEFITAPNIIGYTKEKAIDILTRKNIKFHIKQISDSNIVSNQFPKQNISYDKNKNLIVIIGTSNKKKNTDKISTNLMPKLVGLSIRKAILKANKSDVKLKIKGSGSIVYQSINPGKKIKFGTECLVKAKL